MSRHSDILHVEQIHPIHGTAIRTISSTVMAWKTPRTIVEGSGRRHFLVDSLVALRSALLLLAWLLRHNWTPCLRTLEESREVANPRSNRLFAAMEKIERRLFQWSVVKFGEMESRGELWSRRVYPSTAHLYPCRNTKIWTFFPSA
jgi:hypothetical protein